MENAGSGCRRGSILNEPDGTIISLRTQLAHAVFANDVGIGNAKVFGDQAVQFLLRQFAGDWVKRLGARADTAAAYYPIFTTLAVLVLISLLGLMALHAMHKRTYESS